MTDAALRSNVHFILVEPMTGGNVGASARAIKNMGFGNLGLVEPAVSLDDEGAFHMAHNAMDVLRGAARYASLDEAIGDKALVVGVSRRLGKRRGTAIGVEEGAGRLIEAALRGPVAVLFGREQRGLYSEEAQRCGFLMPIPVGHAQPSLNLAQAVLIVAYELHKAMLGREYPPAAPAALATREEQQALYAHVHELLGLLGCNKRGEERLGLSVQGTLQRALALSMISPQDAEVLRGLTLRLIERLR